MSDSMYKSTHSRAFGPFGRSDECDFIQGHAAHACILLCMRLKLYMMVNFASEEDNLQIYAFQSLLNYTVTQVHALFQFTFGPVHL